MLLSTSAEECLEGCPPGLRTSSDAAAAADRAAAVASFLGPIEALASAPEVPTEVANALRRVAAAQADAVQNRKPERRGASHRILSLGMRRPELGPDRFAVNFASYTHCDPHFDLKRTEECPEGGSHLLVIRIEDGSESAGSHATLSGLVEVEEKPRANEPPNMPSTDASIAYLIAGPIYTHFTVRRGPLHGFILRSDGSILVFGPTLSPHPITASPALRAALLRVLGAA